MATDVISPTGRRDTKLVGLFRLLSAAATGATLITVGQLFLEIRQTTLLWAIAFSLIAAFFAFLEISYGGRAARAEERRIRVKLLTRQFEIAAQLENQQETYAAPKLIQLMTDNTERLTEYRQVYFGATLAAMAIPFLTLAYIGFFIDPVVGFGVMILVPLIPFLIGLFMHFFRKTSAHSRKQRAQLSNLYLDAIRNLVTIRLLGAGPRTEQALAVQGEANRGAIMRLLAGNQIVIIIMDGLFALVLICVTAGLTLLRAGEMNLGQILAIILLTVLLLEPLQQVAGFFYIGMGGRASQKAISTYLGEADTLAEDLPATRRVSTEESALSEHPTTENMPAIRIAGVNFDYGRGQVLHDINLSLPEGGRVAIVGRSGAGKSTLLKLLQGALPLQTGSLAIAGHDLAITPRPQFRKLTATVAQSTWMFTGTIADNLKLANPTATEEQMWHALRQAQVAPEIERMPQGIHTYLGEGAGLISGGQAQRISLARAILSNRKVLLLDEPTSQVDIESEARIIAAISQLPADWSIVMITHRPSLLQLADQTYEMVQGKLSLKEVSHVG